MRQQGDTLRSCPTSRTLYARPLQEVEFENCAPLDILHTHGELAWSGCLSKTLLPSRGLSSSALLATPSCVLTCAVPGRTYPAQPLSAAVTAPGPATATVVPLLLECSHHIRSWSITCVLQSQVHKGQVEPCRTQPHQHSGVSADACTDMKI